MRLGVMSSLEAEDAALAAVALAELERWSDRVAACEAERVAARQHRYAERYDRVPSWVERGMGTHHERARQERHRLPLLLALSALVPRLEARGEGTQLVHSACSSSFARVRQGWKNPTLAGIPIHRQSQVFACVGVRIGVRPTVGC
jgi:hypothetical protein